MASKLRKSPPVCLWVTSFRVIIGRLRLSDQFVGREVNMQDGQVFTVFRHITRHPVPESDAPAVFIVSFKFARGSHNANKLASIVPMLLITGFPGFVTKMYGVNTSNGNWQGMYQWQSKRALEEYKKSFVFRMMNKRAIKDSLKLLEIENQSLADFMNQNIK
jgi:hypothetical protein